MEMFKQPPSPRPTATTHDRATIARRASIASAVGTGIQYYDFTIFAYAATTMAPLFFPADDHVAALMSTLAIYGAGFVAAPIGGLVFGRLGDRVGRRRILLITVTLMGVATTCTGLLPTYAAIGVGAPILLALLRVVQGLASGGEVGGAASLVAESVPAARRGRFGASTPMGVAGGAMLASVVVGLVSFFGDDAMASWGWRLPFILSLPLVILGLAYRIRVEESPVFQSLLEQGGQEKAPITAVLSGHKKSLAQVIAITFGEAVTGPLVATYLIIHLTELGYALSGSVWLVAAFALTSFAFMSFSGRLSDRWGRRNVIAFGFASLAVVAFPCYLLMDRGSLALALVAGFVLNIPQGLIQGPIFTLFAEQFPSNLRNTGISLGFNVGVVLGAAPAAVVATWLVATTGLSASPAFYLILSSLVALATLLTVRNRAGLPLP